MNTSLSRKDNYLKFFHNMRQRNPAMTNQSSEARGYFLACYTVSLVQEDTINGIPIKHSTIKKYLDQDYTIFGTLP